MELPKRLLHLPPLCHRLRRPTPSTRDFFPPSSHSPQHSHRRTPPAARSSSYTPLASSFMTPRAPLRRPEHAETPPTPSPMDPNARNINSTAPPTEAGQSHHFHVFATKHNTHITLTDTRRVPLISISSGSIGFRKAQRGSYDAAYQLGGYMLSRIQEQGLVPQIERCELVFRGFGPGREALAKILISAEGGALRSKWTRVTDATRLKFGGQRSKKPRRLG